MSKKKASFFSFLLVAGVIIAIIVGVICIKNWYYERKHANAVVSWQGTTYEWAALAGKDSLFVSKLTGKFIELEGVLLNVVNTQGATTVYFTSGMQTDTSYLVGQQPDWLTVKNQSALTACDSLILMYGRQYNFQPAAVPVIFSGDVVNADSDKRLDFSYFEDCRLSKNKTIQYRLHNFCAQAIKVRAILTSVNHSDKGLVVELDEVMVLSKEKNKIKFQ
ncbi:MAG: hypothetical protein K0R51_284 [Cytophagaceae bacterium]|jgi:hypothetical protein|nr:hypothetical protein [Cytophagaceae bacterium]